jgi:hypothetical protein
VRHFARSARWRQVFFIACLPYIVVSVLVESLHSGTAPHGEGPAPSGIVLRTDGAPTVAPATAGDECPACNWLRLGRRIESPVGLTRTQELVRDDVSPVVALWPDSPVPHPSLFRGPPRPVLS